MTNYTWLSALSGDWNTGSLWSGGIVPNSDSAYVTLSLAGTVTIEIAAAESETVHEFTPVQSGDTLSVDGTLQFAGAFSPSVPSGSGTIAVGASGVIEGIGLFAFGALINHGTLLASDGANYNLIVDGPVTNDGLAAATSGVLQLPSLTNLANSVLTGGTYDVSGFIPANATSAADNLLVIGLGANAGLTVDAATIVLDGPASVLEVSNSGGTAFALEQELQTIAAAGTLAVLDGRSYQTSNALQDAGAIVLGGGTLASGGLSVAATGTLSGYGTVTGSLSNAGAIIASGGTLGTLILDSPAPGGGSLTVAAGSEMILPGGSASAVTVNGSMFDTGTLTVAGSLSGTGTITVENGGALAFGGPASASLVFGGSNVTVTLSSPGRYAGTLTGFGTGDTLVLGGIQGNAATIVNGNTLAILSGGTTLDTIALSGSYTGATFSAVTSGTNTVVTSLTGAPARDGMPITLVSVDNAVGASATIVAEIEQELTYAAEAWGQYVTGAAPLRVSLTLADSGAFGGELANGGPGGFVSTGSTYNGDPVYEPDSLYALQTGDYASGFSSDINITVVASAANLASFYFNPNPAAGTAVPLGYTDLLTVLTHEFGHGLGFIGLINSSAPTLGSPPVASGSAIATYDQFVSYTTAGATFDGTQAEAAYGALINAGTSVPLPLYDTTDPSLSTENFYHPSGSVAALSSDVMQAVLPAGTYRAISNLDLAVLADTGVPVTAAVACFARATLIRTPDGDVAVEDLAAGDRVVTLDGAARPVVWIGRRSIDCRRHPRPADVRPVRIAAGAFAPNAPDRDLFLSPNHAVYLDGALIPVRLLVNGLTVTQTDWGSVDYYHIELASHDVLLANGLPAESYLDCGDRSAFNNPSNVVRLMRAEPGSVRPGDLWEALGCAPLLLSGPALAAARDHLLARAILAAA